jgi:hypothetical protein
MKTWLIDLLRQLPLHTASVVLGHTLISVALWLWPRSFQAQGPRTGAATAYMVRAQAGTADRCGRAISYALAVLYSNSFDNYWRLLVAADVNLKL